jgi:heptosyltransferase-2
MNAEAGGRGGKPPGLSTNRKYQRIVIRTTNWLGDAVMSLAAVRELRRNLPDASLTLIAQPRVAGFYRWIPEVDRMVVYDPGRNGSRWRNLFRLVGELRRQRADVYLCLQNAFEAALIGRLAGIPNRIGFATDGRSLLLTRPVAILPELNRHHQVYYYLSLLRGAGLSAVDYLRQPEFRPDIQLRLTPEMDEVAGDCLRREGISAGASLVGIHAGAFYGSAKRWFPERFAELLVALRREFPLRFLLLGASSERPLADDIQQAAGAGGIHNLCGRTSLEELVAVIGRCRLFISNDSGPMHVAAAFQIPQVALFGSTDPVATGPFSPRAITLKKPVECSPCFLRECPLDLRCFKSIGVEDVLARVRELLYRENSSDR